MLGVQIVRAIGREQFEESGKLILPFRVFLPIYTIIEEITRN